MRACTRTGDSGTKRQVASAPITEAITPSQKIESTPSVSTSSPLTTRPMPPPMPNIAEIVPMLVATFSRGNSSRMMPIASGRIAPPAPCTERPTMYTGSEWPNAAIRLPRPKTTRAKRSMRSLPYMSPKRPTIGVVIEEAIRKAVSSQVTFAAVVCRSRWICGSAGTIIVCASVYASAPSARTKRVRLGFARP